MVKSLSKTVPAAWVAPDLGVMGVELAQLSCCACAEGSHGWLGDTVRMGQGEHGGGEAYG